MDVVLRLVVCVSAVYVLVYLAGTYDAFMRRSTRRRLMKQYHKRWNSP